MRVSTGVRTLLTAVLLVLLTAAPAHAAGRLDRSFAGGAGWRTLGVGGGDATARTVLVSRHGKLLLGGQAYMPRSFRPALGFARLHPSGRLDRRFGRRGQTVADPPGFTSSVEAMAELPDGQVLAAFQYVATPTGQQAFGMLRLRADGRVDRTYGENGYATLPVPGDYAWLEGIDVLPDGGAVLVGGAELPLEYRTLVGRLDRQGRPAGEAAALSLDGATGTGVAVTRGGEAIVAATREPSDGRGPLLTTLFAAGADGQPLPAPRHEIPGARVIDMQRDGARGIGVLLHGNRRWGVRRYSAALRPRRAPARLPSSGLAGALAMSTAGSAWVALGDRVARVRPDGRPDRRWGRGGRSRPVHTDLLVYAAGVAALPRGRVVAAGWAAEEGDIREDYGKSWFWAAVWR